MLDDTRSVFFESPAVPEPRSRPGRPWSLARQALPPLLLLLAGILMVVVSVAVLPTPDVQSDSFAEYAP